MALATLFDDFPLVYLGNGDRRRSRPLLCNLLDTIEEQVDQKVGHVFRRLPSVLLDMEDEFTSRGSGKKRKLASGALNTYEPKSKVLVSSKDDKYKISLDASNYQPEEITVKVVNDKIAISAKHEAKGKDVYEFYEMYRSFDLPEGVDPNTVTSRLNASGQLTVEVPLKTKEPSISRTVPIQYENKDEKVADEANTPAAEKDQTAEKK